MFQFQGRKCYLGSNIIFLVRAQSSRTNSFLQKILVRAQSSRTNSFLRKKKMLTE